VEDIFCQSMAIIVQFLNVSMATNVQICQNQ